MSKLIYYGFLCAVSFILVSGLPTKKEDEIENAPVLNDEPVDIRKYDSEIDAPRLTREAAPQRYYGGGGRGRGSGSNAQAGSFNFGGGRGRPGFSGSIAEANSFSRGGRGRGGSRSQADSFNFNTPLGSFSGSEASSNSFSGRRG